VLQADELPDWHAYLNGCSTITAFKNKMYLKIRMVNQGVKIKCNSGAMKKNQVGNYGSRMV
jgi:hypothetical protein